MEKTVETAKKKKPALNKPIELSDAMFKDMILNHFLVAVECWAHDCSCSKGNGARLRWKTFVWETECG